MRWSRIRRCRHQAVLSADVTSGTSAFMLLALSAMMLSNSSRPHTPAYHVTTRGHVTMGPGRGGGGGVFGSKGRSTGQHVVVVQKVPKFSMSHSSCMSLDGCCRSHRQQTSDWCSQQLDEAKYCGSAQCMMCTQNDGLLHLSVTHVALCLPRSSANTPTQQSPNLR